MTSLPEKRSGFHPAADQELSQIVSDYVRALEDRARLLAASNDADEVQRGHVFRARTDLEKEVQKRAVKRDRVADGLKIIGGAVMGAALGSLFATPSATVGDRFGLIALAVISGIVVAIGVFGFREP